MARYANGCNCESCKELRDMLPAPDYTVTCARCGKVGKASQFMIEEGDEWECPPCYERCEAAERASHSDAAIKHES